MDGLNLTITPTPVELSDRVQYAVDELLNLKSENINYDNANMQKDLWYCKMVINILTVGEYCNHLPSTVIEKYNINWRDLIQPRNSFAHTTPEAIRSTVINYINNINLRELNRALPKIIELTEQLADIEKSTVSANIPKTILKVIHNCFESKLTKPGTALPLFDDKLIAQITDLSTKTIRHLRKEYTSQNEDISPKPITHNIGAIDF